MFYNEPFSVSPPAGAKTTVSTTSVEIVPANPNRSMIIVSNPSSGQVLWLGFGANAAVVGNGIPLNGGEKITFTASNDSYGFFKSSINGIYASGSEAVPYQEA